MFHGNIADVPYIDFAKAFDSVYHRFLLAKIESFGSDPIKQKEPTECMWPMCCRRRQESKVGYLRDQ